MTEAELTKAVREDIQKGLRARLQKMGETHRPHEEASLQRVRLLLSHPEEAARYIVSLEKRLRKLEEGR